MKNLIRKQISILLIILFSWMPLFANELPFGDKPMELKIKIEKALANYVPERGNKIIAMGYFPGGAWDYFIILKIGERYYAHNYIFDKKSIAEGPVVDHLKRQGKSTYWIVDSRSDKYIIEGGSVEIWDHGGLIERARVFNPS